MRECTTFPCGGCSYDPPAPRLFDLVLVNHVDHELVPLRVDELKGHVDHMAFGETEYTHSSGEPKPLRFKKEWLSDAAFASYRPIRGLANISAACNPRAVESHPLNALLRRKKKRGKEWVNRCRESFSRNALGQMFEELGGRDDDWALLSDADEIPRPEALALVRQLMRRTPPARCALAHKPRAADEGTTGVAAVLGPHDTAQVHRRMAAVSLGATHHFKYTLGCERPWRMAGGTWLKGPIAVPGALLKAVGAQAVRTLDGCFWAGFRASCKDVRRRAIANASWHMSSLSGGFNGHLQKMVENSAHALYTNTSRTNQFTPQFVLERALRCQHGEDMQLKVNDRIVRKGGAARGYMPTPWGLGRPLPVYPDVPRYIERALAEGRMRHFLSWNTSDHSIDRRVDPARVEPLGRPWYDSGPTLVNESLLPHAQYRLT